MRYHLIAISLIGGNPLRQMNRRPIHSWDRSRILLTSRCCYRAKMTLCPASSKFYFYCFHLLWACLYGVSLQYPDPDRLSPLGQMFCPGKTVLPGQSCPDRFVCPDSSVLPGQGCPGIFVARIHGSSPVEITLTRTYTSILHYQCSGILDQYTSVPVYRCTSLPVYSYAGILVYQYTNMIVYWYTGILVCQYTNILAYQYTSILLYWSTSIPVYQYTGILVNKYTSILVEQFISILAYQYSSIPVYQYTSILVYQYTSIFVYQYY